MASTAHQDFKGHHLKPRPYEPHNNEGRIKVARFAPLNTELLATSDEELLKTLVVEMGCPDSGMWYVDTAGCGILQANPANPPPKNGFVHRVMRCAAVLFLTLMVLAWPTSCQKEPKPTPTPEPTPTDTITPVVPGDTITPVVPGDTIPDIPGDTILPPEPPIDTIQPDTIVPGPGGDTIVPGTGGKVVNFYYDGGNNFPSLDTVRRYANNPEYDSIYIKWVVSNAAYWTPSSFHVARDSLSKRFNISPKVYGGWWVVPYQIVPDADSLSHGVKGMARCDSVWYADRHYNVWPVNKSAQPPRYNGNRVLKAEEAILPTRNHGAKRH